MNGSHEEMRELVAAYVLGAVPAEEAPFIRAHISTCDECMAEAEQLQAHKNAITVRLEKLTELSTDAHG